MPNGMSSPCLNSILLSRSVWKPESRYQIQATRPKIKPVAIRRKAFRDIDFCFPIMNNIQRVKSTTFITEQADPLCFQKLR